MMKPHNPAILQRATVGLLRVILGGIGLHLVVLGINGLGGNVKQHHIALLQHLVVHLEHIFLGARIRLVVRLNDELELVTEERILGEKEKKINREKKERRKREKRKRGSLRS